MEHKFTGTVRNLDPETLEELKKLQGEGTYIFVKEMKDGQLLPIATLEKHPDGTMEDFLALVEALKGTKIEHYESNE